MAHCPKCGKKLRLTDISQFCPACGVNMRFVDFEENFYKEAKIAELSQAGMHVKIKRLKAAFVGSMLTIARLIVMILPIVALLLPNGSFTLKFPFISDANAGGAFGIMGLVSIFTNGNQELNYLLSMSGSVLSGAAFSALKIALFSYIAVAVIGVVVLLLSILCFISVKNMQKIIAAAACIGIVCCIASMVLISRFVSVSAGDPLIDAKNGFGLILCILMFAVVFVVNFLLIKKGIPVEYGEGMLERVAILKKVKAKEIDIDSLPQPVVETEETRKIDEEIRKEEESYRQKHAKEATENG